MFQQLPGVGPALADRLLLEFGSVERVITAAEVLGEGARCGFERRRRVLGNWSAGEQRFGGLPDCPFLARSVQQAPAWGSKSRQQAKAKSRLVVRTKPSHPAKRSKDPQRAANAACSGC